MANNPTIISASLNDKELRDSIDKLVKHVEDGTQRMAKSMDDAVEHMKKSLQSLGNINVNMGGASDGGASRRTKKNVEEEKSVKDTTVAYDKLAETISKVEKPKSARESFYAFAQGFKEQAQHLQQLINNWENLLLARKIGDFNAVGAAIDQTTQKINALKQEITQLRTNQPVGYRDQIKERETQIDQLKQKIVELRAEQQKIANAPIQDNEYILRYRAQLEQANNAMRDGTMLRQQQAQQTQEQISKEEQLNRKIQRQAEIIRERMQKYGTDFAYWGNQIIFDPATNKGKLSIEEQLLAVHKQSVQEINDRIAAEQREEQLKVASTNQSKEQLGVEQLITQEQEKRKKYTAPTVGIDTAYTTMLANQLKIGENELISYSTRIKNLSTYIKQLKTAYSSLNESERNTPFGKELANNIQYASRELQKFNAQMSRPVSLKAAMGLDERTLDDISHKIRQLNSYAQGLRVYNRDGSVNQQAKKELDEVIKKTEDLKKRQQELLGSNKTLLESNNALARSWNYMKNRMAFYFTVGASTQFVKQLIDIRGQYEMLERSIGILFDSMQTGTKIFSELNAMAIKSPFTTMELGAAAKQLSAYNIAAKDVVDTTRRLADIAAAVGVPIERLTYALGQIKSYGYLNSRDARMFANAGIPLIQNLADMYTKLEGRLVSIGDVYDRIKKKQISFEDTISVINEMTDKGGRFFNFQEKAADTLKVKLANLTLAWNNFLNELGKSEQGILNSALVTVKNMLDAWRNIDALLKTIALTLGIIKTAQLVYLLGVKGVTAQLALQEVFGKKIAANLINLGKSFFATISNPYTWIAGAIVYLGYLGVKLYQIKKDNEAFNESISKGAKENIESIDKFVKEYGKDIESIGSLSVTDQAKLWERVREEIEKTSKNAKAYIELLESIPDVAERVTKASSFFEQEKRIQTEAKRLADLGLFNVGGGFGDEPLAKNLTEYESELNRIIRLYGSLDKAIEKSQIYKKSGQTQFSPLEYLRTSTMEVEAELNNFVALLDRVNINKIIGDYQSKEEAMAYIRDFSNLIRDNFLATEVGQKVSVQGQARLNAALDEWIAKKGKSLNLLNDEYFTVEANRTAWEQFFSYIQGKDKETLDYLISSHKTGGKEFQRIWDGAATEMSNNATAAYMQIQQQIADLRKTPDIVINLVYRSSKENLDAQQQKFVDTWITPKDSGVISADTYLEQEKANRTKYGRLMRKQDEDNVEWEKRLGEEYVANAKNIENLNKQLANSAKMSGVDIEKKKSERDLFVDLNSALKDIEQSQGFDFSQFEKGSKGGKENADELAKALSNETKLVNKLTTAFDKLAKAGMGSGEAMRVVRKQFGGSIAQINSVLNKFGLQGLDISIIQGKDPNAILKYFTNIKKQLEDKGLSNLKRLEPVEAIIESVEVSARTYNLDKITKGLNNELGKLKDEYELAVELEANPELGNMFAAMFGVDTSALSSDIYEYADKMQKIVNKAMLDARENNQYDFVPFDLLTDDINEWAAKTGVDLNSELAKSLIAGQKQVRSAYKSYFTEIDKQTKDLQYKLADTDGKIAIEEEKLARLQQRLANETHEEKRRLLELEIQEQQQAINKLKEELLQLLPTYKALFGGVAEHSAYMTRKLARQMQDMLNDAERNQDGSYTVTDPRSGQKATVSATTYANLNKKVNEEIKKSATPLSKIKEAFTKGEDGVTDWAKGIEYLGEELQKMSTLVNEIGNFAVALGLDEDTAAEIKSVADTIAGVSTAIDGFTKIAAGDYIGGTASILSGATSVITSWLNNKNEKINRQIEKSELVVKRLENAYKSLSDTVENSYGIAEVGAQRVAIANKKLQLAELKRQLQLEKSRDAKDRDKSKIADLEGQIIDLELEIKNATNDIVNDLLGISSVGSAAESLVSSMIESFKKGEDYMGVFADSFEDMIDNMIMKAIVSQVIGDRLQELFDKIKANKEGQTDQYGFTAKDYDEYIANWEKTLQAYKLSGNTEAAKAAEEYIARLKKLQEALLRVTPEDIRESESMIEGWKDDVKSEFEAYMAAFGIKYGEGADKNLSNLQQGIAGVSEETASAVEGYLNGISQQIYIQTSYLEQIVNVMTEDADPTDDIKVASLSQILLQLRSSYEMQSAIKSMLEGWSNATGMAVRVEMI